MKLTFFLFTDLRTGAGTERVALELIKNKPMDIDIQIIETDRMNKERISEEEIKRITKGCRIIKIPFPKWHKIRMRGIFTNILNVTVKPTLRVYNHLSKKIIDDIHDTDAVYFFNNLYSVFYKGFKNKIPLIGTGHTGFPIIPKIEEEMGLLTNPMKKIWANMYYKIYSENLNGIHLFTHSKKILDLYPYKYKMVLGNGVDTSAYYPDILMHNGTVKFLFVARLEKSKGLFIIQEILKRLNCDFSYEFHIAGGGSMEYLMREMSKNNKRIIYHGILKDSDLEKLYRECDVFVYPTLWDTFAIVVLQALSSGLYVIDSEKQRGTYDDFLDKNLEYLHPDPLTFYNRMVQIIQNRKTILFDKKMVYNHIKENYDWKVISDKFYTYMRDFYNDSNIQNKS